MSETPEIISFYSYKGGTGRSLAVLHIADYLSSFGKSVLAIDMDLEAPGLHYKFSLLGDAPPVRPPGLVDLMYDVFVRSESLPNTLGVHCVPLVVREGGGWIRLLPAGDVRSGQYWSRLAKLNWYDLFYGEGARGLPFFLELLTRLSNEFNPDYILIDSRTGITELGGVASTILPDKFVCIFTNSLESLEGTREVLRSVRKARRLPGKSQLDLYPVLARIPETTSAETEQRVITDALRFLNEPADSLTETLSLQDVTVLHSEPHLQLQERVLTRAPFSGPDELPLMRDYLRLFAQLIPRSVVEPHITNLVNRAFSTAMEDPDNVETQLEAIAGVYPHEESFRALLKFYRLRRAPSEAVLRVASRLWRTTKDATDPLLYEAVESHFPLLGSREARVSLDLSESVWLASNSSNARIGLAIAKVIASIPGRGASLGRSLTTLLSRTELTEEEMVDVMRFAITGRQSKLVVEHYQRLWDAQRSAKFQTTFVEALLDADATDLAKRLVDSSEIDLDRVKLTSLSVYARLLAILGRGEEMFSELDGALEYAIRRDDHETLAELGRAFRGVGQQRLFEQRVREDLPAASAEFVLSRVREDRALEIRRLVR